MIPTSTRFDQPTMSALLDSDPVVAQYRTFFSFFEWSLVEDWQAQRCGPGRPGHPESAYLKAFLIRQNEQFLYTTQLRRFLLRHPLLVIELGFHLVLDTSAPYGFDSEQTLPCRYWLTQKLRLLDQDLLQALLQATVLALQHEIPGLGEVAAFDVKHIYAWVKENNPRVYVKDRYDKDEILSGDPQCKLGVKRSSNRDVPDASAHPELPAPSTLTSQQDTPSPAPTTSPISPAKGKKDQKQEPEQKGKQEEKEYLWGYGSGVAAATDPVYGDVVLAEYTLPFNEADLTYFRPLLRRAVLTIDQGPWGRMTGTERARLMRRLAMLLEENAERLAIVESTDNGKLIREMGGQLKSLPEWYYYFAGAADKLEGETIPSDKPNFFVYTRREPIGVVGAITPWNSPLLLLTFKLAPALAAGCTFVVKPSEHTSASTLEFARLFAEAGFPPGVFNVVTGYGPGTGVPLVRHPGVDKVAFTGSTATGIRVMKDAADHLARLSLELGGKSPNIVFDDADEGVVNGIVAGIFAAGGQTCIAGSRLFVQARIHDAIVSRLAERARAIKLGDPLKMETEMGPAAFKGQQEKIKSYIDIAQAEGAHLAYGGHIPTDPELVNGFFVEPTIFTHVDNRMRVAQEEIFGPVLSVIPFETEEEVIRQANDTRYGLAAGIWTGDIRRAHRVAHALRAGTVWINSYRTLSFNTPFGGYKMSGIGTENGLESVREYTHTKAVWVELSGQTRDPFKLG